MIFEYYTWLKKINDFILTKIKKYSDYFLYGGYLLILVLMTISIIESFLKENDLVSKSNLAYALFAISRSFFSIPFAFAIASFFKERDKKTYLWLILIVLLSVQMTTKFFIFITNNIGMYLNFSNEQYVRFIFTILAFIILLINTFRKRFLIDAMFSFAVGIYLCVTVVLHYFIIDTIWNEKIIENNRLMEIVYKSDNEQFVRNFCQINNVSCIFKNGENIIQENWITTEKINTLDTTYLHYKNNIKYSYKFKNNILLRVEEDLLKNYSKEEYKLLINDIKESKYIYDVSFPILLSYTISQSGVKVLNTKIGFETAKIRMFLSIISIFSVIIWLFLPLLLIKKHKEKRF